jgi:hypothetical protein
MGRHRTTFNTTGHLVSRNDAQQPQVDLLGPILRVRPTIGALRANPSDPQQGTLLTALHQEILVMVD